MKWEPGLTLGKTATGVLDYRFDWSDWLETGDTIASHTVTPEAGLTLIGTSADDTGVTAWVSGGTDGEKYKLTCAVVTSNAPVAREDSRDVFIWIGD